MRQIEFNLLIGSFVRVVSQLRSVSEQETDPTNQQVLLHMADILYDTADRVKHLVGRNLSSTRMAQAQAVSPAAQAPDSVRPQPPSYKAQQSDEL